VRLLTTTDLDGTITLEDDDLLIHGDNADVLPHLPDAAFDVIVIDPPFNTGTKQVRRTLRTTGGFKGRTYTAEEITRLAFDDAFDDFVAFLAPRLTEAHRLLAPHGTLYLHLDPRESHYCKVLLDGIFGRECFLNEIVWAYDYGARTKRRWPAKHDTILVYVKDPEGYHFDSSEVDREPYMAPGLQTAERAAAGKLPTDVWWHTIVPTSGKEKTGYPTQKPEGIVRRMVTASSRPDGWCLDFFAGSGTLGAVAQKLGRRFVLVDVSSDSIQTCLRRLTPAAAPPSPHPPAARAADPATPA
jgi:site-specific DNA-methyltransferase (adenine-specific)